MPDESVTNALGQDLIELDIQAEDRQQRIQPRIALDPEGAHALRVHLQTMDTRAQKVQAEPAPPNAGT